MIANQSAPSAPVVPVLAYGEDAEGRFAHAKRFSVHIISPPENLPFGVRHDTAHDPGGHWWTFSQNVADVGPHEWGAVAATPRS